MRHIYIRNVLFIGLAAFVPLPYYLAVVGGLLPFAGILIIAVRNVADTALLWFSLTHLAIYGVGLYWMAELIARFLFKVAGSHVWPAAAVVLVLLAIVGLLPIFGIAHGNIDWTNAYLLYFSGRLR